MPTTAPRYRWWSILPFVRPELETWADHPDRVEYRAANDGWGMCNTGARVRPACYLGGIGCNVDHPLIYALRAED